MQIAELLRILEERFGWEQVELLEEIQILLKDDSSLYDDIAAKRELLQNYLLLCMHHVSGKRAAFSIRDLAENLRHKAEWMMDHIRKTEWIEDGKEEGWFNSYYDNSGKAVEGYFPQGVRMMLTGQVFAVMGGTAEDEQITKICSSADRYLYQKEIGGYRLNTNFHEQKYDLGRMFGFAYGEKENGAVFSHMTVMYANALYRRGFVKEGYKALQTLADTALDFQVSRIYPGIPEYFNASGRGMYHYLTGAASWYMLTAVTEVFGVRGETGDLVICPKLVKEQFGENGNAGIRLRFAQKEFQVSFHNPQRLDYGEYEIKSICCDGRDMLDECRNQGFLERKTIASLPDTLHEIKVELGRR